MRSFAQLSLAFARNTWVFEMERPVSGSVEFKILLNDEAWESGNNHIVQVGNTIEVTSDFS